MSVNLKLSHQAAILIGIPLIFQIVFVSLLSYLLNTSIAEAQNQSRAKSLIAQTAELGKMLQDAGLLLYTYKFAKSEIFDQRYEDLIRQAPMQLEIVKNLAGDQNALSMPIRQLEAAVNESMWTMQHTHRHLKNRDAKDAEVLLMWQCGVVASRKVMTAIPHVQRLARTGQTDVAAQNRSVLLMQNVLVAGVAFNLVAAVLLAFFFYRGTNRRLAVVMENSSRLVAGETLIPELEGNDEPAQLDAVFHKMASELNAAQEKERAIVEQDKRHREEIDRLKQEFVDMISHDLRTPLMSVQTDLFLLSEGVAGELPGAALKHVHDAEKNTEYVISLINNLLDVERMSSGKLDLFIEDVFLPDLCQRAVEAVKALAINKNINVETSSDDLSIAADEERLTQVLVNLLSNAIKFSSKDSTVTVTARDAGEQVELRVADQGRGIPADQLDHVFARFHQVENADARNRKGTGLGLAICKSLVEQHGGDIGVESEEGKGCTFWFRLPKTQMTS